MPRNVYHTEPIVMNSVIDLDKKKRKSDKYLEVATTNEGKLAEIKRILTDYEIVGKKLDIEEVQSTDPYKVVKEKAKAAYETNDYNPILVEDTSMDIRGLDNRPGTYVNDFCSEFSMRKLITEEWLKEKDRTAVARVCLGIYDGIEAHIWEGKVSGKIAETPVGTNGFGWDDIFIPDGDKKGRTFAQMSENQKDKFSMRRLALEKFSKSKIDLGYPILQLPEPYLQEMERIQIDKLQDKKALKFAYKLEAIETDNKSNPKLEAPNYSPLYKSENSYFTRFVQNKKSKSLGLIFTDVDRKHLKTYKNGDPILWQRGPERRTLALAQRAEFFMENQNEEVHKVLDEMEKNKDKFPKRVNKRSVTIEQALGFEGMSTFTKARSLKEIGYKKLSAAKKVSRTATGKTGLFTFVGKYPRSIYGIGCLPYISGWRDVIVTAAIAHIPVFVHRNHLHAIDFQNQIDLIKASKETIQELNLGKKAEERAFRNIGAALGCDPKKDLERAILLYKEAGVKLFRIYTINSDPRVIETARVLRDHFGDEIEIFVGQLVDKKQCRALVADGIKVDGLIFGHGGGRQCTSATNGMALSTLEEVYSILTDYNFNDTSVAVEGGIGSYVGALLLMGVDCILRNGQFANCVIEQGDVYFEHKSGKICQPYHGSASAATMIIESYNKKNAETKLFLSGRTRNVEGKSGYIFYQKKANSMAFYVNQFKHYAARTLADIGVDNIWEMREYLAENNEELFRIISMDASHVASAYKTW